MWPNRKKRQDMLQTFSLWETSLPNRRKQPRLAANPEPRPQHHWCSAFWGGLWWAVWHGLLWALLLRRELRSNQMQECHSCQRQGEVCCCSGKRKWGFKPSKAVEVHFRVQTSNVWGAEENCCSQVAVWREHHSSSEAGTRWSWHWLPALACQHSLHMQTQRQKGVQQCRDLKGHPLPCVQVDSECLSTLRLLRAVAPH